MAVKIVVLVVITALVMQNSPMSEAQSLQYANAWATPRQMATQAPNDERNYFRQLLSNHYTQRLNRLRTFLGQPQPRRFTNALWHFD